MSGESFSPRPAFDDDVDAAADAMTAATDAPLVFDASRLAEWKSTQTAATYASNAAAFLNLDGIPAELRALPRWFAWAFTGGANGKKPGKVPLQADGSFASTTDPSTWGAFDDVVVALRRGIRPAPSVERKQNTDDQPVHDRAMGLSFAFNGDGIVGIDLDGCRDPVTGEIAPWALDELAAFPSWTEVSPSGTGLHIFVRGRLPGGKGLASSKREMYAQGRFFAMTGCHVEGTPRHVVDVDDDRLAALAARIEEDKREEKAKAKAEAKAKAPPTSGSPIVDLYARDVGGMGRADFDEAVAEVASAIPDTRNNTLNECAYRIGRMVAGGVVTEGEAFSRLADAVATWESPQKNADCIRRALRDGLTSRNGPWTPSQRRPTADELERVARMYEREQEREADGANNNDTEASGTDAEAKADREPKAEQETSKTSGKTEQPPKATASTKTADDWPEPLPLDTPPAVPFPVAVLPDAVRGFVEDLADRTGGDVDMAAVAALVTCAGAIGRHLRLQVRPDWHERACLWGAMIASPGRAKSPILSAATAPLKDAEQARMDDGKREREAYDVACKQARAVEKGWQKATEKAAQAAQSSGEAFTPPPMPDAARQPTPPASARLTIDDATREALASHMAEGSRGLTLIKDELADWLANFSRHNAKGTDRGFYLTLWSGGRVHVDRVMRGSQTIDDAYLSVIGALQPSTAQRHLTRSGPGADDGLVDRFGLLAFPDEKATPKPPTNDTPDEQARRRYATAIAKLAALDWQRLAQFQREDAIIGPPTIHLSPEARDVFEAWNGALCATARSGAWDGKPASRRNCLAWSAGWRLCCTWSTSRTARPPTCEPSTWRRCDGRSGLQKTTHGRFMRGSSRCLKAAMKTTPRRRLRRC